MNPPCFSLYPPLMNRNQLDKEKEPDPSYWNDPIPSDPSAAMALLQKELARQNPSPFSLCPSFPDVEFVRKVLRATDYKLSRELRSRAYAVLLGVDSDVVQQLADNNWTVKSMNDSIIEDYIHNVYTRFADSRTACSLDSLPGSNEASVTEQVMWVVHGVIVNTSAPYSHCDARSCASSVVITTLALLLISRFGFGREFTLLFILSMFETSFLPKKEIEPISATPKNTSIPAALQINPRTDAILNQKREITDEVRLPLFSLSRGKSVLRLHSLFHLLVRFHLPTLCAHLDKVTSDWWCPYSYPIEKQDDFITVVSLPSPYF